MEYIKKAIFVYSDESAKLIDTVCGNPYGTEIFVYHVEQFVKDAKIICKLATHIVLSLQEKELPSVFALTQEHQFSIGFLPLLSQKEQLKNLALPANIEQNLDIALQDDARYIDLLQVNETMVYTQGAIGDIPLFIAKIKTNRFSFWQSLRYMIKKVFSLSLQKIEITTNNGQKIVTAAMAVVVLNHTTKSMISKIFGIEESLRNGSVTAIIISPASVSEYLSLFTSIFFPSKTKSLPSAIGYVQSKSLEIFAKKGKNIRFDSGEVIALPVKIEVAQNMLAINASEAFWEKNKQSSSTKETIKVANLPDKVEALKYNLKHIPLFKVVSEDRFKDLFIALRADAKFSIIYLVLMFLSTLLAAFGLFTNSTAVIIGAMLVAPLMAPIISLSMGLLRGNQEMTKNSLIKIALGVFIAVFSAAFLAYMLPLSKITPEMMSRVNPTLLDLAIAIFSGVAAAYSKSHREIAQNLAGVAIAVALVPPLAVSGIGLGYGQFHLFFGSFLLFFTNLVGITLAAIFTFWVIGFSNALQSKKSFVFVLLLLATVSVPLYFSYAQMMHEYRISSTLHDHRFIVNDKYIIVDSVGVVFREKVLVLNLKLMLRESLDRDDLNLLKEKMQKLFDEKIFVKAEVEYIL